MSNFKKLLKITWKRFGLWILLISIFVAMITSLSVRNTVKYDAMTIRESVETMAKDTNISIDSSKLDKNFLAEADKVATAYVKKYELKPWEFIDEDQEEAYERYANRISEKFDKEYYLIEDPISRYTYIRNLLVADSLEAYPRYEDQDIYPDSYAVRYVKDNLAPILIFVFLIGLLITSLERSLPYYEFTMMYPWKKSDEVFMKSGMVFIFGLLILAINMLVGFAVIKSSALGPLISLVGVGGELARNVILILAMSLLSVATGMIAGNFVGHLGMFIIAAGGFELIGYLINALIGVFSNELSTKFSFAMDEFEQGLPTFVRSFYSLLNNKGDWGWILGFLAVASIWAIFAYLVNKKTSAENAGYLVISRPFEILAKVLGILSFTSILYMVINSALFGFENIIFNLLAYGVSLLISYKLFDILFKVRLKF